VATVTETVEVGIFGAVNVTATVLGVDATVTVAVKAVNVPVVANAVTVPERGIVVAAAVTEHVEAARVKVAPDVKVCATAVRVDAATEKDSAYIVQPVPHPARVKKFVVPVARI
jgi:hypothetical protein